jgi:ABC-type multidrug transport system permease subunit
MPLYTYPNATGGIDIGLSQTAQAVPAFPIMILVFTFFVIFLGGSANQKRRVGSADLPFWAVLGATSCTFLALIFTLGAGMIDDVTLGIVVGFNVLTAIWFFFSKVRGEM